MIKKNIHYIIGALIFIGLGIFLIKTANAETLGSYTATKSVSSNEILNLGTTGIQLIPEQEGVIILPRRLCWVSDYGTTTYASGANPVLSYNYSGTNYLNTTISTTVINSSSDNVSCWVNIYGTGIGSFVNQPLTLKSTTNFTTGNGTATVYIAYDLLNPTVGFANTLNYEPLLPDRTGQEGTFLSTDGVSDFWSMPETGGGTPRNEVIDYLIEMFFLIGLFSGAYWLTYKLMNKIL